MVYQCARDKGGLCTTVRKAHVQVRIIQIEPKPRIKTAKLNQTIPPKGHVRAFGPDGRTRLGFDQRSRRLVDRALRVHRCPVNNPAAPLKRDAIATEDIPARCIGAQHGEWSDQVIKPCRLGHCIIIYEGNDLSRGHGNPRIPRGRDVRLFKSNNLDTVGQTHPFSNVYRRLITDENDLEWMIV